MTTNEKDPPKVIILGGSRSGLGLIGAHAMARELIEKLPPGCISEIEIVDESTGRDTYVTAELDVTPLKSSRRIEGGGSEGLRSYSPFADGRLPKVESQLDSSRKNFRKSVANKNEQIKKDAMERAKKKRLEREAQKDASAKVVDNGTIEWGNSQVVSPDSEIAKHATPLACSGMKSVLEQACENYRKQEG